MELNPIWNGHASREGFGNKEFQKYLNDDRTNLKKTIPNIYNWLDYAKFYEKMYDEIATIELS